MSAIREVKYLKELKHQNVIAVRNSFYQVPRKQDILRHVMRVYSFTTSSQARRT